MEKNVSWKQKIKYVQIAAIVLAIVVYNLFYYTKDVYAQYETSINKIDSVETKQLQVKSNLTSITTKLDNLKDIYKNKEKFIKAYNGCYTQYKNRIYSIGTWNGVSFRDCINKDYNKDYILKMTDVDLEEIGISFWIYKDTSTKMSFNQSLFLASLDKNIFSWKLKQEVPILSFWQPTLINKKLWLYKVSFSFTVQKNYSWFINLFKLLQNKIFIKNTLYYTIDSISPFDIMNNDLQNISVQWSFYFSK